MGTHVGVSVGIQAVAGFHLGGTLSTGRGLKIIESHFVACLTIFLLKLCLKIIASEEKFEKKIAFWAKDIIGPQSLREGAPGAPPPPPPDPLVSSIR